MKNKVIRTVRMHSQTECNQCPIRNMALFRGVPKERLDWTQKFRQHQFIVPPKTTLYLEGTKPDYVYTLFDGWMMLYQSSSNGKRQILRFALPGDFLGFQAGRGGIISHSVAAITKSTVCGFPRDTLKDMFEEQPILALRLATMEANDINMCQQHQMFGSRKDSHASIAFLLLELFHRTQLQMHQHYNADDNSIAFPFTQEDIGDAVGLTNVHVNRVLRQFGKDRLIECRHRKLKIINENKLAEIGEFNTDIIAGNPLI